MHFSNPKVRFNFGSHFILFGAGSGEREWVPYIPGWPWTHLLCTQGWGWSWASDLPGPTSWMLACWANTLLALYLLFSPWFPATLRGDLFIFHSPRCSLNKHWNGSILIQLSRHPLNILFRLSRPHFYILDQIILSCEEPSCRMFSRIPDTCPLLSDC